MKTRRELFLNEIALEVPDPCGYLVALSIAMRTAPLYSDLQRKAVDTALAQWPMSEPPIGRGTPMRALGFVDYELIAVLDREWQDYDANEADQLFHYATARGLFASAKSVFLWGAGSCRLADYLSSHLSIEQIVCSDLSWPALNFGKALIEAKYSELPEILTKARAFYHVNPESSALVKTYKQSRFKPPLMPEGRRACIRYAVRDAFAALEGPIAADMIVVPYLLDNFRGEQCISLLIRICQRITVGQQIVILVTCIAQGARGPGRDPGHIIDVLHRCGFKVQFLDLAFLPYSFSCYSYAQVHSTWNTLVVRAERTTERPTKILVASSERQGRAQGFRPEKGDPRGPAIRELILGRLVTIQDYEAFAAALMPEMEEMEFEDAIGDLLSRGLIHLRVEPV